MTPAERSASTWRSRLSGDSRLTPVSPGDALGPGETLDHEQRLDELFGGRAYLARETPNVGVLPQSPKGDSAHGRSLVRPFDAALQQAHRGWGCIVPRLPK